jgi:signal transduction histidine kinase
MATPDQHAGIEDIEREELSRLFGRVIWARVAALPVLVGLVLWVLVVDPTPWRRPVMGTLMVVAAAFFLFEAARHRAAVFRHRTANLNLTFAVLAQAAATFATGGLGSPLLIVMFPIAMIVAITIRRPMSLGLVLCQIAVVWAMALVDEAGIVSNLNLSMFGGGEHVGWNRTHLYANAAFASAGLVLVTALGRSVRHAFDTMLLRINRARQESARAHAELFALSGEIAHELKNPLATIKGLSGLLAQDVATGKPGERLGVLRREVDRMQGVLEEFLNFSRPLLPLSHEPVDLGALCREVVAVHEGMALERKLTLTSHVEQVTLSCDPRKVEQILLNLVQNALEASPAGSMVELEARPQGGHIEVRVLDRGPGLNPELADRAFEPGVTSKPQGSGLGLTIARALARQHRGDLTLQAREGGGCVAVLRLPGGG